MEQQLKHIAAKVKPGGQVLISCFYEGSFSPCVDLFLDRIERLTVLCPMIDRLTGPLRNSDSTLSTVAVNRGSSIGSSPDRPIATASITGPIFTFGGIKGQVQAAEAVSRQAELAYRQTVLNAFRETNDALTGSQKKIYEVEMQQKRVDALREFARLSALRFDKGVAGYLDVLVAEDEAYAPMIRHPKVVDAVASIAGRFKVLRIEVPKRRRPATGFGARFRWWAVAAVLVLGLVFAVVQFRGFERRVQYAR